MTFFGRFTERSLKFWMTHSKNKTDPSPSPYQDSVFQEIFLIQEITTEYRQTPLDVNNLLSVSNKKKLFSFPLRVFQ